jgi:predicted small lipoprotein YifL
MKKRQIIAAMLFVATTLSIASCGSKTSENNTEKTDAEQTEQVENVQYQCPMKCEGEKTYNEPGQCPKCNMDLEQVEENQGHSDHNH